MPYNQLAKLEKTQKAIDGLWDNGTIHEQTIEQWGAEHMRTPYRAEEWKAEFLKMAGIWSETEEGEAHYQMMKHRNDERPLNREINFDD